MELYTPNSKSSRYIYFKTSLNVFKFKVRAEEMAHIALATYPDSSKPYIEIVIDHFADKKKHLSYLRTRNGETIDLIQKVETNDYLNKNEHRGFWITFNEDGTYKCGREGEDKPFLEWKNPTKYEINYIGVYTFWSEGLWNFDENIQTSKCKVDESSKDHTEFIETPNQKIEDKTPSNYKDDTEITPKNPKCKIVDETSYQDKEEGKKQGSGSCHTINLYF